MNCEEIGNIIKLLRKEKGYTQIELAEKLYISDKAISKWERGLSCPDISLLSQIADIFEINLQSLLNGNLCKNDTDGGNMKKIKFYVCPICNNIITSTSDADVSCCARKLQPLNAKKASGDEKLTVQKIENEYFVSSEHEMTKEHYISFAAIITGDSIFLKKQYPEWNLQTRFPCFGHGILVWHCTKHGLFYQLI